MSLQPVSRPTDRRFGATIRSSYGCQSESELRSGTLAASYRVLEKYRRRRHGVEEYPMRVSSCDTYAEVREFDPATGCLTTFDRDSAPNAGQPLRGLYQSLGGAPVVLYRDAGQLWLRVGDLVLPADAALRLR